MVDEFSYYNASNCLNNVMEEMEKVIVGKRDVIQLLMICLTAGGHILIEDMPGVGKTTLALALSKAANLEYKRIQFTPDTMPSDITGFNIYNRQTNEFEYRQGAAICNLLLADEINRTVAKTQSSLLEAMEEGKVTIDGVTHIIPTPFIVIATQNPYGFIGTHALPEAQLDRFLMKISLGYPTIDEEIEIISARQLKNPLELVKNVITKDDILNIQSVCRQVYLDESIKRYIVNIVSSTRNSDKIKFGASPRASIALMKSSQACAVINNRNYVIPEDVAKVAVYVLSHRITANSDIRADDISNEVLIQNIVKSTHIPYYSKKGRN